MAQSENILLDKYDEFVNTTLVTNGIIDTDQSSVHDFFKHYGYPFSSWPILISAERAEKLSIVCRKLPGLLNRITQLYFKNNVQEIADYYFNGNTMFAEFALMAQNKNVEISYRLDLILGESGFKVLEANIGSAIGGYEGVCFETIIRKKHKPLFNPETSHEYHSQNMIDHYFKFLVDQVIKTVDGVTTTVNFFVHANQSGNVASIAGGVKFFNDFLQLELKKRGFSGGAYSGQPADLQTKEGALFLNGKRMHGVLTLTLDKTPTPEIFRAFISNKIYYPDHPGAISISSDKRNLALLRELAEQGKLPEADCALILEYIPWTTVVEPNRNVRYSGTSYPVVELLKSNKDDFVIKDATGSQGDNVYIGKYLSPEAWTNAIDKALNSGIYIAQEFTESLDFIAPNVNNQWTPHKLIWGAFGFGDQYGGVFIRMAESEKSTGVINTAIGAVEAIVYEINST